MTLEQKLLRIKEIQDTLQNKKIPLDESVKFLEEAYKLKKEIEKEISIIENKITKIQEENEGDKDMN